MPLTEIDAIIFDCDGVLVESEVLALEVELATLLEFGLDYDRHEFAERYMGMPDVDFFPALAADFRRRTGSPLAESFPQLHDERLELAIWNRLTEVRGARWATAQCRVPMAVASSSTKYQLRLKLQKVGLWERFDPHIYSTESVARGKPAPDLFQYAAAQMGAIPAQCLVVEDSVNGVRAGCAAGMVVWAFIGGGHCTALTGDALVQAGATKLIADWERFVQSVEKLNSPI